MSNITEFLYFVRGTWRSMDHSKVIRVAQGRERTTYDIGDGKK